MSQQDIADITDGELDKVIDEFVDAVPLTKKTPPLLMRLIRLCKLQGKIEATVLLMEGEEKRLNSN